MATIPYRITVSGCAMPRYTHDHSGFTLIELLIVVVIIGLLAAIAVPKLDDVRQKAFDSAVLADLNSATYAIEEYYAENLVLPTEAQIVAGGFALSPDVSFTTFSTRDPGSLDRRRVHMHIEHAASLHYFHHEYPGTDSPEKRWK